MKRFVLVTLAVLALAAASLGGYALGQRHDDANACDAVRTAYSGYVAAYQADNPTDKKVGIPYQATQDARLAYAVIDQNPSCFPPDVRAQVKVNEAQ